MPHLVLHCQSRPRDHQRSRNRPHHGLRGLHGLYNSAAHAPNRRTTILAHHHHLPQPDPQPHPRKHPHLHHPPSSIQHARRCLRPPPPKYRNLPCRKYVLDRPQPCCRADVSVQPDSFDHHGPSSDGKHQRGGPLQCPIFVHALLSPIPFL